MLQNSFYENTVTLIPIPENTHTAKKDITIFWMNMDEKILNKILINQNVEKIIHCDQVGFISVM
jgi:hypothetical protein